ncbi:MAG: hypothetical protein PHU77_14715 [Simplicispira sp.]|nr:hypothetical protein [Simplicispira sp.]
MFIMVVHQPFQMHLGVGHLKGFRTVERYRLTDRCEGLAEKGEQQDDCKQSAHSGRVCNEEQSAIIAARCFQPARTLSFTGKNGLHPNMVKRTMLPKA